jgi:5-methylcytosine-specific restriction endonuclease McrA
LARQRANFNLDKAKIKSSLRRTRLQKNPTFLVTKRDLEKMQSQLCAYCKKRQADSIDHIIPVSRGGSHGIGNLVGCCRSCNSSKGTKTLMEWKKVRGW